MWVKVDDGFPEHRKVLEAGRHLGTGGAGRVIAIWTVGMCYSGRALLDGVIPRCVVETWKLYDRRPVDVADVMAMPMPDGSPGLMVKVDGGYKFHDYEDYQPLAKDIKKKRRKDRDRKRAERAASESDDFSHAVHADTSWNPARSRARDPDPGPSLQKDHRGVRREISTPVENLRVLKALIWREAQALHRSGAPFDLPSVTEHLKCLAARSGLVYSVEDFYRQVEVAVDRVPRQFRRSTAA